MDGWMNAEQMNGINEWDGMHRRSVDSHYTRILELEMANGEQLEKETVEGEAKNLACSLK